MWMAMLVYLGADKVFQNLVLFGLKSRNYLKGRLNIVNMKPKNADLHFRVGKKSILS